MRRRTPEGAGQNIDKRTFFMSDLIKQAVKQLSEKLSGGFDGSAKFVLPGEGSLIIDSNGVREGDEDTDVTLTASVDTFKGIMDGTENPTAAFMAGNLTVDGDMGAAMKLASVLG